MAWTPTAPAAIAGLVAALQASAGLTGVPVLDGPVVTSAAYPETISVGFISDEDATAAEGSMRREGLVVSPDRELFTIRNSIHVLRGAGSMPAARARVFEIYAAAGAAIAADHKLGGAVMSARLADWTLQQMQVDQGAYASLVFGVECDAFTGR